MTWNPEVGAAIKRKYAARRAVAEYLGKRIGTEVRVGVRYAAAIPGRKVCGVVAVSPIAPDGSGVPEPVFYFFTMIDDVVVQLLQTASN
jgi:hypothetical protein